MVSNKRGTKQSEAWSKTEFRLPDSRLVFPLRDASQALRDEQGEPESESGYDCLSGCVADREGERGQKNE